MDTRRQADSLAVSNLTVSTDCSTAVISDCQMKLFKGGNYSRAETIRGNTVYFFLIYSIRVGSTYDIASEAGVLWTVEIVPICKYHGIFGMKKNTY